MCMKVLQGENIKKIWIPALSTSLTGLDRKDEHLMFLTIPHWNVRDVSLCI